MGERCAAHHADHIIVISEPIKKLLYEKYPFCSNVSLIHNGISELQLHSANCDYINRLHLIDNGYKVLRIKGNNKDDIPSKEEIDIAISKLLGGEDIIYIDMNN